MTIYDVAEPIEAYRCWQLTSRSGTPTLRSVSFNFTWNSEVGAQPCDQSGLGYMFVERHLQPCNGPPCSGNAGVLGHGCGIYALKSLAAALFRLEPGGVVGKVLLGGTVWPHEHGYRAEEAKIVGLYPGSAFDRYRSYCPLPPLAGDHHPSVLEDAARLYGVDLLSLTTAEHEQVWPVVEARWVAAQIELTAGFYNFRKTQAVQDFRRIRVV